MKGEQTFIVGELLVRMKPMKRRTKREIKFTACGLSVAVTWVILFWLVQEMRPKPIAEYPPHGRERIE